MKHDTHRRGDIAEASVLSKLVGLGYTVSLPIHGTSPYDLVVDVGGLKKVQVKNATTHSNEPNSIRVELRRRSYRRDGGIRSDTYDGSELDVYAVYWDGGEEVLWIPFDEAPDQTMNVYVGDESDLRPVDRSKARLLSESRIEARLDPQ